MSKRIDSEADLIATYLAPLTRGLPGAFGLTDDAALLAVPNGHEIVVSADPIIAGVHFFADDRPEDIAWKALAVNMSDLAAKGADPMAYLMTLALPAPPETEWMRAFAAGLAEAQAAFGCTLAGGDTDRTPGPLSIGVTAVGTIPRGTFVRRRTAQAGDHVFVSGTLGDAAFGLKIRRGDAWSGDRLTVSQRDDLLRRYLRPQPRLALRVSIRDHASAALDISDGFLKDVARLAGDSGFDIPISTLPLSDAVAALFAGDATATDDILAAGDDYELLIAVPPQNVTAFADAARASGVVVTNIGTLKPHRPIVVLGPSGTPLNVQRSGYDHFSRS